jgi:hypothetical protein
MKPASIWLPLLVGVFGCGDHGPATSDAPTTSDSSGSAITITITSDRAPALVAFRDGVAGPWQAATMRTPTTFEAEVHGPYVVTVVCEDLTIGETDTFQLARTPEDARDLVQPCDLVLVPRYAVTGHMVQAGSVQLGTSTRTSTAADWDFTLDARSGTSDLLATTFDRMVLRRGIAVTGNTAVTPAIDVLQEGTLLAGAAFTVTNAAPNELLSASVSLDRPSPATSLTVYRGPIGTAKVAPNSVLTATDTQSASVQGVLDRVSRALRRPFQVGGNTTYTLPAALSGVEWAIANGDLGVSWSSVPAFDTFLVATNKAVAMMPYQRHVLSLSPRFFEATGATGATLDTAIPGYQPEWRVAFTAGYFRQLVAQRVTGVETARSSVTELTSAPALAGTEPRLPPLPAGLAQP